MNWFYLLLAGLLEIFVVAGIRDMSMKRYARGMVVYALGISTSLSFLYLAMRSIDVSVAYTAYTGIGVIGTVLAGILLWGDSAGLRKFFYLTLIVASIVVLKLAG
ncbi:DMT family transporter [Kerstersia gyiorum]|uniref:DMT family transporter n=1 Tax=Kerstersia gyiorum TaxID=206506 RepID=UPI00209758DF|nr:SMR family transporter [Kerstersia gyiorum]MCO7636587.1 SMR family transporter [Pseudomonas sp. S 311-6]MCP1637050.1 quaternary ammonium compound-resistance protein SugE/paired small multidrug resistance pump [Kerstersia gyiorum]MCP1670526.1 quaternary ammonium compound-resistance protein SugE/paired small multidrug resistance pump [Kerstersia gyiorum]MCP1678820.1 quaternary ammonium compound-resistance protein SugE/paired small multidrug resistance pump [Kerstersia gyiorum]MCP1708434.1 qua